MLILIHYIELFLGLFIVGTALHDVFQAVVVPRWSGRFLRLSPWILSELWPRWRDSAYRFPEADKREDWLGTFAPLTLMLILMAWVVQLIVGFGLAFLGLSPEMYSNAGLSDSLYLAGSQVLTVGMGGASPDGFLLRVIALAAAASGLAVVALVISLTFALYGSFQRREVMVLSLDARAGNPPSGVTLLETYAHFDLLDDLPALFYAWELWAAEMLESHLAYPILPYFRSSHDNESWVSAIGAVLDAATLLMTVVEVDPGQRSGGNLVAKYAGAAHLMYGMGCHTVIDLSHFFRLRDLVPGDQQLAPNPLVERGEFEAARASLQKAGFRLKPIESSWADFSKQRAVYASALNEMAKTFATPPTLWIGDRSTVAYLHHSPVASAAQPVRMQP